MKRNLIAAVILVLASAQAGVALADNDDSFADAFWSKHEVALPEMTTFIGAQPAEERDLVNGYSN